MNNILETSYVKRPLSLVKVFSLTSFLAIIGLMISLSWLLGYRLEKQLLEREKILAEATVKVETTEYLADLPFDQTYKDEAIHNEILHTIQSIPGTFAIDIIETSGLVAWSTNKKNIGKSIKADLLIEVLTGKSTVDVTRTDKSDNISGLISTMLIPIIRDGLVIGVYQLNRNHSELYLQLHHLKLEVFEFCAVFGTLIYLLLMAIIFPAARTITLQHNKLIRKADSLRALNEKLKETQEQLIRNERLSAIGEVCGSVAHGLKNPIAGVRTAAQLLCSQKLSSEERDEIAGEIISEVDRVNRRLNDILNFIRPFELNLKEANLLDILEETIYELHWKSKEKMIQINLKNKIKLSPTLLDVSIVEETLLIILSNSIEASYQSGTITCSLNEDKENQTIIIKDEGRGIPENILPKVFDQFFTTRSQGVGLGLFLCKKYMHLHKGKVEIYSKEKEGTSVILTFPKRSYEAP